jgi:hypothetical protein
MQPIRRLSPLGDLTAGPVAWLTAVGTVWRDHLNAVVSQLLIQRIAVIGAIADQILRLGFDHVEVEAELHRGFYGSRATASSPPYAS